MNSIKRALILFFVAIPLFALTRASAQSNRSCVYNIQAQPETTTSIKITWDYNAEDKTTDSSFVLYRSNVPFAATSELAPNLEIAELKINTTSFSDKVLDYHEYYYAVLVKTSDGTDRIILPSINATVNGVHRLAPEPVIVEAKQSNLSAQEKIYPEGTLREIPLPTLDLLESEKRNAYPMNEETVKIGSTLLPEKRQGKILLDPYAFEQDLISPESGDNYLLFDILHKTFARKDYKNAIIQLNEFLSVYRTDDITCRTRFYLGECLYFTADYTNAVMTFLKVQDEYPTLTRQWIDACLDLIATSNISD